MGKSINLNIEYKKSTKENLHNFLNKSQIEILEKINKEFSKKILIKFSSFLKSDIKLNFCTINKNTHINSDKNFEFLYCNSIKILPSEEESFIFFSSNLLSIFINFLFGGNNNFIQEVNIDRKMTYTENCINKKIIKLIVDTYYSTCRDFFSFDVEFIKCQIINLKQYNVYSNDSFITNFFSFSFNEIQMFLSILLPIKIINHNNEKKINSIEKNIYSKKKFLTNNVSIKSVYDIELDVIVELFFSPTIEVNCNKLSKGDILVLKDPKKIIGMIEKKPIFLGQHKICNNRSLVFLEELIVNNLKK